MTYTDDCSCDDCEATGIDEFSRPCEICKGSGSITIRS